MTHPVVLDPGGHLRETLGHAPSVRYVRVGVPAAMSDALAGRQALITGASQGLGLAIARAFLTSGASVFICGRDTADARARASRAGSAVRRAARRWPPSRPTWRIRTRSSRS